MLYFKFNRKPLNGASPLNPKKRTLWRNLASRLCKKLLANPDFDDKLKYVAQWYLEYDEDACVSCREIGLDNNKNVIVKMPDERNYGFWLDTNFTIEDFKAKFGIQIIKEQEFNNMWNSRYIKTNNLIKREQRKLACSAECENGGVKSNTLRKPTRKELELIDRVSS